MEQPRPFKFQMGEQVKDRITGFEGIVLGQTHWLTGCNTVTIQPQALKDGMPLDAKTFDEPYVEKTGPGMVDKVEQEPEPRKRGGPHRPEVIRPNR